MRAFSIRGFSEVIFLDEKEWFLHIKGQSKRGSRRNSNRKNSFGFAGKRELDATVLADEICVRFSVSVVLIFRVGERNDD